LDIFSDTDWDRYAEENLSFLNPERQQAFVERTGNIRNKVNLLVKSACRGSRDTFMQRAQMLNAIAERQTAEIHKSGKYQEGAAGCD